jgi:hypothetical protein
MNQQPEIIPPEKAESLGGKLKQLLLPHNPEHPPQQQPAEGSQNPGASTSGSSSEFNATATELEGKYQGVSDVPPGNGNSGQSGPAPESGVPKSVVSPQVVEAFFVMLTESLARNHGNHWRMTDEEKLVVVPVNVAMINEQVPKLFGDMENPALWTWALVMAGWIGTKSENVGKAVSAGVEKIISIVSGGGGKVEG